MKTICDSKIVTVMGKLYMEPSFTSNFRVCFHPAVHATPFHSSILKSQTPASKPALKFLKNISGHTTKLTLNN